MSKSKFRSFPQNAQIIPKPPRMNQTQIPLEAIPSMTGWKSATSFRERFRAAFGQSMLDMRKSNAKTQRRILQ